MSFNCVVNAADLQKALVTTSRCVLSRTPKDILRCCKLSATESNLFIETSNLENSIRASIPCDTKRGGDMLLTFTEFRSIIDSFPGESVSIDVGQRAVIKCGSSQFRLGPFASPGDFPVAKFEDEKWSVEVSGKELVNSLAATAPFRMDGGAFFALQCSYIESASGKLHIVSTNTKGMAIAVLGDSDIAFSSLIPPDASAALSSIAGSQERVTLKGNDSLIWIETESSRVVCRLGTGKFPRWRDVLPEDVIDAEFTVPAGLIRDKIDQCLLTAEKDRGTWPSMVVSTSGGVLKMESQNPDNGSESTVEMPIESPQESSAKHNGAMLKNVFRSFAAEDLVSVELRNEAACVAKCGNRQFLFMPLEER